LVLRTPLEDLDQKLEQWLDSTSNLTEDEHKEKTLDSMLSTALELQEKVVEVETDETPKLEEK
jgi:hypothetical protein